MSPLFCAQEISGPVPDLGPAQGPLRGSVENRKELLDTPCGVALFSFGWRFKTVLTQPSAGDPADQQEVQRMGGTKRYWALKTEFEQRFGEAGKRVFNLWYDRIIEPLHWGYWRNDEFGQGERPWNTDHDFDRGWAKRLSKTRLYQHFLARRKDESVYYTSTVFNEVGEHRLVFPMFDIDDKQKSGQAPAVLERLKAALPMVTFYACPSTSGAGIHAYACLGFPKYWSRKKIVEALRSLSHWIAAAVNVDDCCAKFDRITGTPHFKEGSDLVRGVLGRVPALQSPADCEALYLALGSMTLWSELPVGQSLGKHEEERPLKVCEAAGAVECGGEGVPLELVAESEGEWRCGYTEQFAGSNPGSLPATTPLSPQELQKVRSETSTIRRRQDFAMKLCRQAGQALDAETLINAYEESGIATGPRTPARSANFKQIAQYIAKTFDAEKLRQGFEACLAEAKNVVEATISEEEVQRTFERPKNRAKLDRGDVAAVYAMYLLFSARKKFVAISWTAAHSFSSKLKEGGVIQRVIDHKRFAACKRLLEAHGLITLEAKGRKGVMAARYSVNRPKAV